MSIIDLEEDTSPPIAETVAKEILRTLNTELERRIDAHLSIYQTFWHNSQDVTPQEICDALGTKAALLFAISSYSVSALNSCLALVNKTIADVIDPTATLTPPSSVTVHQDGTVSIGT